jgi:hypothetical protein
MKRPSHATAIAYLALFIALGSGAYAATQLPKNSVGSKQLKKKAVTTAKLKDGAVTSPKLGNGAVTTAKIADNAVTGAKVDESSLSQVPSAASATTATSAATASALDGIGVEGFLRTNAVLFGSANLETATEEPILTVPGKFQMTTTGDNESKLEFAMKNLDTSNWYYVSQSALHFLGPGASADQEYVATFARTIFAVDGVDPADHAIIDCAFATTAPARIYCSVRVPPAS